MTIYYYELLEMIQKGDQPKYIWYNHKKFTWHDYVKTYLSDIGEDILNVRLKNVYGDKDWEKNWQLIKLSSLMSKFKIDIQTNMLDKTEKNYLNGIIRPFKDRVVGIAKISSGTNKFFISIYLDDIGFDNEESILLPMFNNKDMYAEMEVNKIYKLYELGL